MSSPPQRKARGELACPTARQLIASTYYVALALFANIFGAVFWFVEQRRWRVADRIDDEDLQS